MKLIIYTLFFSCICVSEIQVQFKNDRALSVEIADLYEGQQNNFKISITNDGDKVLKLYDKNLSCGCLKLHTKSDTVFIAAHQSTSLDVTFSSKGFSGKIVKFIGFRTNDPENPFISFKLKCNVIREISTQPPYFFTHGELSSSFSDSLYILNNTDANVEIDTVITNCGTIQISLTSKKLKPFGSLKMFFKLSGLEPDQSNKKIVLFFHGLHHNVKEIPIYNN